jgi:hypothetical protein
MHMLKPVVQTVHPHINRIILAHNFYFHLIQFIVNFMLKFFLKIISYINMNLPVISVTMPVGIAIAVEKKRGRENTAS